jgi:hypothetical protein
MTRKSKELRAAAVAFLAWFRTFESEQLWREINEPGVCPPLANLQAAIAATAPKPRPPREPREPTPDINKLLRARPRDSRYGAAMGARNRYDGEPGARLYCQRVRFVDGDYAPDGTYWGGGRFSSPLYAVFTADLETLAFYRATSRADAAAHHAQWTASRARLTAAVSEAAQGLRAIT